MKFLNWHHFRSTYNKKSNIVLEISHELPKYYCEFRDGFLFFRNNRLIVSSSFKYRLTNRDENQVIVETLVSHTYDNYAQRFFIHI